MGADLIIAIDISTPLLSANELISVLSVAEQVSLLTQSTVTQAIKHLGDGDALITPDLKGYSTADFDLAAEIIAIGEKATRNHLDAASWAACPPSPRSSTRLSSAPIPACRRHGWRTTSTPNRATASTGSNWKKTSVISTALAISPASATSWTRTMARPAC